MTLRTRHAMLAGALLLAGSALPAGTASAATGGTSAPGDAAPPAAPATGGVTLVTAPGALVGGSLRVRGSAPRRFRGRTIQVQVAAAGARWTTVARATAARNGAYSTRWRSQRSGRFAVRAVVASVGRSAAASSGVARVTFYPGSLATWYGPTGTRRETTACGVTLTRSTLGVAHRTLPCGTRVELYYAGRTITVPVIDRGPYANGASWDLTVATSDALGFTAAGLDRIGALPLGR